MGAKTLDPLKEKGEYLSLFKHFVWQILEGRSSDEVCDRKWLLHEGRGTAVADSILESSAETLEDVEQEHRAMVVREWNSQGIREAYVPEVKPDPDPVLVDGYEVFEGCETPSSLDSVHGASPVSLPEPEPSRCSTWKQGDD